MKAPELSPAVSKIPLSGYLEDRHIGPQESEVRQMLDFLGQNNLESLIDAALPKSIKPEAGKIPITEALSESQALKLLRSMAQKNQLYRSYLGLGYNGTLIPSVIMRNVWENPGWYTAYTPYQAEIAQGRLETLFHFQTMISELTGLPVANASLLDEATAAAEAMCLGFSLKESDSTTFFVSADCHPQVIDVLKTRATPLGIQIEIAPHDYFNFSLRPFGIFLPYPTTNGVLYDYSDVCKKAHAAGAFVTVSADLLSLVLLTPPGEFGADIAVGSTQRFGVPLGGGGPHAAYMAIKEEFKRLLPGRIVGLSKDAQGKPAYRLALQTREQHIRREKATSNICTAQVLPAVLAAFYAIYHGPDGLKKIAQRVHFFTRTLAKGLERLGYSLKSNSYFDTLWLDIPKNRQELIRSRAEQKHINLRYLSDSIVIALDETVEKEDIQDILETFSISHSLSPDFDSLLAQSADPLPDALKRRTPALKSSIFGRYHSESEMMRYIKRLESRDLSLTTSMIPLGSCTMKLNAASEMRPTVWPHLTDMHPFAPENQLQGYRELVNDLNKRLCDLTGFAAFSFQPNAGSQGEYTGLLVIQKRHESRGEKHRKVCLIPSSAHGTNPASAARAGLEIVTVQTAPNGDIDLEDLKKKAAHHSGELAALMVTYPSTHGIFEEGIKEICRIIHSHGALVYLDGANMNALVGLCRPADLGVDVAHLNLHKTFCIPHGGGGPGMGPVGVVEELVQYLPSHPLVTSKHRDSLGAVSSAPWGSPLILPISWSYLAQMGTKGLVRATQVAILNANYIAKRLAAHYPILFRGRNDLVAHECIIDLRALKASADVGAEDVAKRLMDYGYHAPTVSWPVAQTLMIEPTESENKEELDRFCEAMILIREEIKEIETGRADKSNNVLKNAPHTAEIVISDSWNKPYSRQKAAYPAPWLKEHKFWPFVGRIDSVYGDRNLVCACMS